LYIVILDLISITVMDSFCSYIILHLSFSYAVHNNKQMIIVTNNSLLECEFVNKAMWKYRLTVHTVTQITRWRILSFLLSKSIIHNSVCKTN